MGDVLRHARDSIMKEILEAVPNKFLFQNLSRYDRDRRETAPIDNMPNAISYKIRAPGYTKAITAAAFDIYESQ
jgi:hypothetical protein